MTLQVTDYIRMSLKDLTTPKGGYICMTDHWWSVTADGDVLFFRSMGSPQCNSSKTVVERIATGRPIETTAQFVPVAYLPHDCKDYC